MAKSKSSTKVTARRKAAKEPEGTGSARRRGGGQPARRACNGSSAWNEAGPRSRPAAAEAGGERRRACRGDGLASPHHPGGADAPAPERPRSPEGEAGYGRDGLPDRARPRDPRAQGRLIMAANDSQTAAVENEIAHLRGLDLDALRARWRSLTGRAAPSHLPKTLLLRVLAYRVQAAAFGDLDKATARLLDRIADDAALREAGRSARPRPGRASGPAPCWCASGRASPIA